MSINLKNAYYRTYQKAFKVVMPVFNWDEPELLKGPGAIKDLPALVKSKGVNNVLIVTDKGLMSLNLLDSLFENLEKQNIKYTVYDGVQPNPSIENIEEARRIYLKNNCEGIIAFGGGSPMDCAKVAGARVSNPNSTVSQMRGLLKVFKKLRFCGIKVINVVSCRCPILSIMRTIFLSSARVKTSLSSKTACLPYFLQIEI